MTNEICARKKIKVGFVIDLEILELGENVADKDIQEWLNYYLLQDCGIDTKNILYDYRIEPVSDIIEFYDI